MNKNLKSLKEYFSIEDNAENFHFSGDEVYADGEEWEAAGRSQVGAQPSDPFIFSLENSGSTTINDVVFLDAFLNSGKDNSPWGVTSGITPTYDIPNRSYIQFLQYLASNSARIRQITTVCSDSTTLRASYEIESYNMQGDKFSKVVKPILNTMQNLTDQVDTRVDFYLTGATRITVSKIVAGKTITFYLFPSNVSKTIKGIAEGRTFISPQTSGMRIVGAQPVQKLI